MPTFPRTILPRRVSPANFPGPMISEGETGKLQLRAFTNAGRRWRETFSALSTADAATLGFLATIHDYWRSGTIFDISHRMYLTPKGVATGTPLVNGASQTGASLVTDGWSANVTGILKAGDVIKIAGLNLVYDITADVNSNASGQATLSLSPPIFSGQSPADNAALTVTGVLFRACLSEPPLMPDADADQLLDGMVLTFREVP
jgi:hypothetical protein